MKLNEFAELCRRPIKVLSAYNGKVLCYHFDNKKHIEIGEREFHCCWSEIKVGNSTYGNWANSVICVYVDGHEEYLKEDVEKPLSDDDFEARDILEEEELERHIEEMLMDAIEEGADNA